MGALHGRDAASTTHLGVAPTAARSATTLPAGQPVRSRCVAPCHAVTGRPAGRAGSRAVRPLRASGPRVRQVRRRRARLLRHRRHGLQRLPGRTRLSRFLRKIVSTVIATSLRVHRQPVLDLAAPRAQRRCTASTGCTSASTWSACVISAGLPGSATTCWAHVWPAFAHDARRQHLGQRRRRRVRLAVPFWAYRRFVFRPVARQTGVSDHASTNQAPTRAPCGTVVAGTA